MCGFCKTFDFSSIGYTFHDGNGKIYSPSHVGGVPAGERFKYCPICGQPVKNSTEKQDVAGEEDNREQSITMTNKEWTRLALYIAMSGKFRERERAGWEKIATYKSSEGMPIDTTALGKVEFWKETDQMLGQIRQKIESCF